MEDGNIVLLEPGYKEASAINDKHDILKEVFIKYLKLDPVLAERDACRVEHVISDETFQALKKIL